ncbi:uncharacterized protein IWZ02DRAFT_507422, partial [Phyllosticta citriasiana]|uniref:uncharacterized protein n=1 Tax=Phyllosticta citriasiana TaxID=595635 RepID=UPI0030FDC9E4
RRLEQDISEVLSKYGGCERIFSAWCFAICRSLGCDMDHRQKLEDDMNFLACDHADAVIFPTFLLLISFPPVVQDDPKMTPISKPGHLGKVDDTGDLNSEPLGTGRTWLVTKRKACTLKMSSSGAQDRDRDQMDLSMGLSQRENSP